MSRLKSASILLMLTACFSLGVLYISMCYPSADITLTEAGVLPLLPLKRSATNQHHVYDEELSLSSFPLLVNTESCHIPDVDPWDPSLKPYVKQAASLNCNSAPFLADLTFIKGDELFINGSAADSYDIELDYCEFVDIKRLMDDDNEYKLSEERHTFKSRISVKKREFIKVYCYSIDGSLVYQNLYALTPLKMGIQHLRAQQLRHRAGGYKEQLNVLMVGIDSVSRLNFIRQFPKTHSILRNKLGAFEFKGYNKVRDNTFINLVPMFLGKYVEETDWNEANAHSIAFDKYPYTWKTYSKAGYHTLFAEDAPSIAIWNFEKQGFKYSPADYYFRPFALAMANSRKLWSNNNHCFGTRLETDIILDYMQRFIRTRLQSPYFAFSFLTRPTYDSVNQNTDVSHAKFLNELISKNLLENTMVVYFSDHGARKGDILSTYIGKLEERLPAMYISFPSWFLKKYPDVAANLKINQNRLTTPFDIKVLLDDVLRFTGERKPVSTSQRGISLFDEVPANRSCVAASIDEHWCTCLLRHPVATDTVEVTQAALSIVKYINKEIEPYRKSCMSYTLEKIHGALKSTPNSKLLRFRASVNDVIGRKEYYGKKATGSIEHYLVTLKVSPSGGIFQATVKHELTLNKYSVLGDISRTSLYGNASWCVLDHKLKKFCFCREPFHDR